MNTMSTPNILPPQTRAAFEDLRIELLELTDLMRVLATTDNPRLAGIMPSAFAVCGRETARIASRLEKFAPPEASPSEEGGAA